MVKQKIFEITNYRGENMNYYLKKMIELNADGIDFIPVCAAHNTLPNIICSYTIKDFEGNKNLAIPRSNYLFYKIVNGKKKYIERSEK